MNRSTPLYCAPLFLGLVVFLGNGSTTGKAQTREMAPLPIRNDIAQPGREFLVLRHQLLVKGSHERFYEISRDGVWPWYEKIGVRAVGQWQVVHPDGKGGSEDHDEGYRLARYRSYEHWVATRSPHLLGGNGPDLQKNLEAIRARNELRIGSRGVAFLQGHMAPGGPYHLPGLGERYERIEEGTDQLAGEEPLPVRHDVAELGQEIITLAHLKIKKGSFDDVHRLSRDGVWPYLEKMGARAVGVWQRVYPSVAMFEGWSGAPEPTPESPDYDEVYAMVHYASYQHWRATRPEVMAGVGGNGPDYDACLAALRRIKGLTIESSVQFLHGFLHRSPPMYHPPLSERYRRIE